MMNFTLPIAEMSVNLWVLAAMGGGVGVMSGIFGVGGGFLLTPLLLTLGIPPVVAVATGANQVLGASVSGVLPYWRRRGVDVRMGTLLLAGGLVGAAAGVWLFAWLRAWGAINLVITLSYAVFLGGIGVLTLVRSVRIMMSGKAEHFPPRRKLPWRTWPIKMRFPRSRLYISVLPPLAVGIIGGLLMGVFGVGGGFFMIPLMVYVVGIPTGVVVGTWLFQVIFIAVAVTLMQAFTTHGVDVVLALVLLVCGMVGAQAGTRLGAYFESIKLRLKGEYLRIFLALVALSICVRMGKDLMSQPAELYFFG